MRILLVLLISFLSLQAGAQDPPIVNIGMAQLPDGRLEVRLLPLGPFDELLSQLQFTVRWPAPSSATLNDFVSAPDFDALNIFMAQSGETIESGGFNRAIFVGLGFSTLASQGQSWVAGAEYVLGHFEVVNGPAAFEMVNDAWTNANNGDFYISLNGLASTGEIVELTTSIGQLSTTEAPFTIFPNPTADVSRLTFRSEEAGLLEYEIVDPAGRTVRRGSLNVSPGQGALVLSSDGLVNGAYLVRVLARDGTTVIPWTIQR